MTFDKNKGRFKSQDALPGDPGYIVDKNPPAGEYLEKREKDSAFLYFKNKLSTKIQSSKENPFQYP